MSKVNNKLFNRDNVEKVKVPAVVSADLLNIIEDKLKKAGFYYRIAYRVKTVDSILDKLISKDYGRAGTDSEGKKMQDLIGVRILLYFVDDVEICKDLLDTLFMEPGVWETTATTEYEFRATKVNGIFKLPVYLAKAIINPVLSDYIDDTFEVQVRTNSFEGWHEIEHDLRYKGSVFESDNGSLARRMNSVLATFELCDDSLVKILEDLGHQHYKDHRWGDMIRCHYRLKLNNDYISQEIVDVFDADTDLAKAFYKFPRNDAITRLWNTSSGHSALPEMSVDYVVRIVNEIGPKDERLFKVFERIDERNGTDDKASRHKKFEPFKTLGKYVVFKSDTMIETTSHGIEEAFRKASGYVYAWIKSRYGNCLHNLPDTVEDYYGADPGYSVRITYDESRMYFEEISTHIDSKIASRVWISKAVIKDIGGRLSFFVLNEYAEPEGRYNGDEIVFFSRPNFYGEVADNLGIRDVVKMREVALDVNRENYNDLLTLIESKGRHFPVVVFNGKHEDWTTEFDIDFFAKLVGYYCHVRIIQNPEDGRAFAKDFGLDESEINDSITVFYRGQKPKISYKSDILESTYEVIKFEQKKYWNENGCRAYRRQLVSEIRQNNARQA
jgi:ppGpp synthetase/RelA/SpoT-type nucleotidyltranferase